ncbi:MAG TPA: hypothetical protein VFS39_11585, partial [Nitrospira sp.]|nr:hypothetical protein [Nitrospira sp.]
GYGSYMYTEMEILDALPENVLALDHLGVLLAIRWPERADGYDTGLRTNVNLFRHVFAFLSESTDILKTNVPDNGYIVKWGPKPIVKQAIRDGRFMERLIEVRQ